MNKYVNPPWNNSLATSFIIRINELNQRRKRSGEDITVCWWGCWRTSIGDWWRSNREECVPWSPTCPQFRRSRKRTGGVRSESFRAVGWRSRFWYWTNIWRRRWGWGNVSGRGGRRTKRWGRRVWGLYLRRWSHASESALRNCFGGCCRFIGIAIILVFILHSR